MSQGVEKPALSVYTLVFRIVGSLYATQLTKQKEKVTLLMCTT